MRRPPYLRWLAAAGIVIAAFAFEVAGRQSVEYPFAASDIRPGATLTGDIVEHRPVPAGLFPAPSIEGAVAAQSIRAGEPILPSAVLADSLAPKDWWALPLTLPAAAHVGAVVRLLVLTAAPGFEAGLPPWASSQAVDGIVLDTGSSDAFAIDEAGLVAIPPEYADLVALAAAEDRLMILIRP